ncbi:MAG TPA: hypothetical protein VFJ97_04250 [Dermatophilaceae bacterium]|nr:hypothetical protein [Dermatophilaceae bacterium]
MGRFARVGAVIVVVCAGSVLPPGAAEAAALSPSAIHLCSVSSTEQAGDGVSFTPSMSEDGRYLAFVSDSTNLAQPHGKNQNLYLRDRQAGTTTSVDVNAAGQAGNGFARFPAVSADGTSVAFYSTSTNLVPNDSNGVPDIFVRSLTGGELERVSVSTAGTEADGFSSSLGISATGRYVAFVSAANNLTADDDNPGPDVFVRDRAAGTTRRVSDLPAGADVDAYWTAISGDGTRVAFASFTNGAPRPTVVQGVFLVDVRTQTTTVVSDLDPGPFARVVLSGDGRKLAFTSQANGVVAGDADGKIDVFLYRRVTGVTAKVSRRTRNGITGSLAITPDGRYLVFSSADIVTNPTDGKLVRFDTTTGARRRLSLPDGTFIHGGQPTTALGGRLLAFQSGVPGLDAAYPGAFGVFTARLR